MIQLQQLEFRYAEGEFRLEVPSLCIEEGETVAIIGPSGTGKTTLLNLIAGISIPLRGEIRVDGEELPQMSDASRRAFRVSRLGLVFQEFELLEYLDVRDNILLPYRIHPCMKLDSAVKARAEELAREVGIEDKLGRYVDQLSQGERQRVAVCRALLHRPRLLLADEPTGNLDPSNKGKVLDILFDYVEREGTTLVTVTHDHELLSRFSRVIDFAEFHAAIAASDGRSEGARA